MIMASPQNSLKLTQTNPYTTQNQNLDGVFRGALLPFIAGCFFQIIQNGVVNSNH
jgi:hypothetical protein